MGWWCITAAPDLCTRLRLTGCCIPVVKRAAEAACWAKAASAPSAGKVEEESWWGACSQHSPCLQALPLVDFRFQKAGKKPELTLLWEPEELEEESVPQVRPPQHGTGSQHHGAGMEAVCTMWIL